jgi:hypothetical protein
MALMGRNFPPFGAASVQHMYTQLYKERLGGTISTQCFQSLLPTAPRGFIGSNERGRMPDTRSCFRKLLNGPGMVIAPFIYECLQARLAQRQGFKAVYMTGFGTAAAHGFPDLDQLTMGKMVENVRTLARSVDISVICDADTGYDEAINVQRTVREYEDRREAIWPK